MTGQLAFDLGPLPVAAVCVYAGARPLRRRSMWHRGHRRAIVNVPITIGAVL